MRDTQSDFAVSLGTTNLLAGQSSTLPLRLTSGADVEQVTFALEAADAHWEGLAMAPAGGEVSGVSFEPVGGGSYRVRLDFDLNQTQPGTRTVAQLAMETQPAGGSSIAHLRLEGLEGLRAGERLTDGTASNGRVFIVESEPILDTRLGTDGNLMLIESARSSAATRIWTRAGIARWIWRQPWPTTPRSRHGSRRRKRASQGTPPSDEVSCHNAREAWSTNLVNWTSTTNGVYTNLPVATFFRISAGRIP